MVTLERAKEVFSYDPLTGDLTFNKGRRQSDFSSLRSFRMFQTKFEGKPAGWRHKAGYVAVRIDEGTYLAHRVAWFIFHGEWPENEIDHINGDRSDNRIANLRVASKLENAHNQSLRITNRSGVNGVFQDKRRGGWRAEIVSEGRSIYLGQFKSLEEAAAARRAAERVLRFHRGHGKARAGDYYAPRKRLGAAG